MVLLNGSKVVERTYTLAVFKTAVQARRVSTKRAQPITEFFFLAHGGEIEYEVTGRQQCVPLFFKVDWT